MEPGMHFHFAALCATISAQSCASSVPPIIEPRALWLYAAWSCKEKEPMNYRTVVPLHPSSGIGEQANRKVA